MSTKFEVKPHLPLFSSPIFILSSFHLSLSLTIYFFFSISTCLSLISLAEDQGWRKGEREGGGEGRVKRREGEKKPRKSPLHVPSPFLITLLRNHPSFATPHVPSPPYPPPFPLPLSFHSVPSIFPHPFSHPLILPPSSTPFLPSLLLSLVPSPFQPYYPFTVSFQSPPPCSQGVGPIWLAHYCHVGAEAIPAVSGLGASVQPSDRGWLRSGYSTAFWLHYSQAALEHSQWTTLSQVRMAEGETIL